MQIVSNRCLSWQAQHCEVKANARGHRLLQKPSPNDVRKIDGLVAAVMALWASSQTVARYNLSGFIGS